MDHQLISKYLFYFYINYLILSSAWIDIVSWKAIQIYLYFICFRFYVDKNTGIISVALCSNVGKAPCLDYETQSNYYLTYIATDDNGNGQSNSVTIMVILTDSNDNPPVFIQHSYTYQIDEGVTIFEPSLTVQVSIFFFLLKNNLQSVAFLQ